MDYMVTTLARGQLLALSLAAALLSFGAISASAQNLPAENAPTSPSTGDGGSNLDSLFANPAGDSTAKDSGADYRATFDSAPKTKVSGTLSGDFAAGAGWTSWPSLQDPKRYYTSTVGFLGSTTASFDARPDPTFRAAGTLTLNYDPRTSGSYVWSFNSVAVSELWADYNFRDLAYLRFGQFGISWGQGRIFTPGNIMSDAGSGFALRLSFPTLLSGVSLVSLAQTSFFDTPKSPSWRQLAVGCNADLVLGGLRIGVGARYQEKAGAKGLLELKTTIFGADLFWDGVGTRSASGILGLQSMAGFFREWGDLKIYGEWYWNGTESLITGWSTSSDASTLSITAGGTVGHSTGLVVAYKHLFGSSLNGAVEWLHSYGDGSGTVMGGVKLSPFSHVTIQIAMPVTYGDGSSYYVANNPDPGKRRIALLALVTIEGGF